MTLRRRCGVAFIACALVASAAAAGPGDYARQWPVLGDCGAAAGSATGRDKGVPPPVLACDGAFALALDESVYRQVQDPALGDIAAFDADGDALAFGPMPPAYRAPPAEWRGAAWFALPSPADTATAATATTTTGGTIDALAQPAPATAPGGAAQDLSLHVTRGADGALQLDATLSHAPSNTVHDLLVDVRADKRAVEAIEFDLALDAPDFSTTLEVDASDDLQAWNNLVPAATIAQLRQQGHALVRRRIEFAPVVARYLRLRVVDGGAAVPLRALRLRLQPEGLRVDEFGRASLRAEADGQQGRAYLFRMPARIPADRLAIHLADDNAIASFAISAREPGQRNWTYVGQLDAFRLRGAGLRLDNEAMDIAPMRAPEWRIESSIDLARPPTLEFSYQPEAWLLLTHGKPPFRVVAGSRAARRADLPLEMLVSEVRQRYGAGWRPSTASLGAMAEAGGDSALRGWDAATRKTWLLWGVLLLAALAIIAMVLRLLRQPPDP